MVKADTEPAAVPESFLPFLSLAFMVVDEQVRLLPLVVSETVAFLALAVMVPPGLMVQVLAAARAGAALRPTAVARATPATRMLAGRLRMAIRQFLLGSCIGNVPFSPISRLPARTLPALARAGKTSVRTRIQGRQMSTRIWPRRAVNNTDPGPRPHSRGSPAARGGRATRRYIPVTASCRARSMC